MKSNTRGGRSPSFTPSSSQTNGHVNNFKNGTKRVEAAVHDKFTDLLSRSCGQTVTATVSSGAKYKGLLSSVDLGANGENALSAVLLRPVIVSGPLIDEKSNVDKTLPLKLVIQAKDLLDLEVSLTHSLPQVAGKQSSTPSVEPTTSTKVTAEAKPPTTAEAKPPTTAETKPPTTAEILAKYTPPQRNKTTKPESFPEAKVPLSKPTSDTKGFKTDRDISKGYEFKERELQRWQPDDNSLDITLEASANDGGAWDQFKTNEEKFGVESTYDEHLYTTRVNTNAKDYQDRLNRAEKLAKEIESQTSNDRHVLEERGIKVDDSGLDEEDKYSGVLKDDTSTKAPVDNRGNELMAALRNASISNGNSIPEIKQGSYSTLRQRAANHHNDPAIISSSSSSKPVAPTENSKQAPTEPAHPTATSATQQPATGSEVQSDAMRLNAQSEFNSLRQFSANFKVPHKIPNDLLPILAKDKLKQDEIMKKQSSDAEMNATDGVSDAKQKTKDIKPDVKKEPKFKLNPKAAAFTPSKLPQNSPRLVNASPKMQNQRTHNNSSGGSSNSRRHNQISAADFFGGASKVPTAQSQKEKVAKFKIIFNPFLTAKRNHTDPKTRVVLGKAFTTPPTWDSTVDQSFEDFIMDHCSDDVNSSASPAPVGAYMQGPFMAVPGAGPHFAASGGFPGGVNNFSGGQPYMQNPMAAQYSQQYQMAMMYQQFQGMPPGQPQMMFAPPGVDPQFVPPGGYMMPQGFQSPTNTNMTPGSPYGSSPYGPHGSPQYTSQNGRKQNQQSKRGHATNDQA